MFSRKSKFLRILRNQRGMSLIEIMIVITLIAVAGSFVATQVLDRQQEAYIQAARAQMNTFKSMLEDYKRYCHQYPTNEQGLEALVAKPTGGPECANYPASAFIKEGKVPKDPWGEKDYVYESTDGKSFVITSYGQDRAEGGEGFAKDIKSNE